MDKIPNPNSQADHGRSAEAGAGSPAAATRSASGSPAPPPDADPVPELPARMVNEFVYCPRLFYYEFVEGVFVANADTRRGLAQHRRVDRGKGRLPAAAKGKARAGSKQTDEADAGGSTPDGQGADGAEGPVSIHSTSVTLSSDQVGVIAKLDVVEAELDAKGRGGRATPVEYKSGRPRTGEGGPQIWDADRVQLGLQMLILRENGYQCDEGVLYYRETRQRVRLPWSDELDRWIREQVAGARRCAAGPIPPPLIDSPKCPRCSLVPVCLPDETNWLRSDQGDMPEAPNEGWPPTPVPAAEPESRSAPGNEVAQASTSEQQPPQGGETSAGDAPTAYPPPPRPPRRPAVTGGGLQPGPQPGAGQGGQGGQGGGRNGDPLPRSTGQQGGAPRVPDNLRRLIAARDDRRALYLNTQGLYVGIRQGRLTVKEKDKNIDEVRVNDLNHIALFGNIQLSTQAVQRLCEAGIPVTWFSMGGWFYGITQGHGLKNVLTRIEQFRAAADPAVSLAIAKRLVSAKVRNQRTMLMRNHVELSGDVLRRLKAVQNDIRQAVSTGSLLGIEGAAAALYFQHFGGMVRPRGSGGAPVSTDEHRQDEGETDEAEGEGQAAPPLTFDFNGRNRRPPRDPVNALLSLAYSLLAKDLTLAAHAVGFDPYVGFFHQPRFGRPALALDLMEEFRPLVADSAVLTAINTGSLTPRHFVVAGNAVNLTPAGRKAFFEIYEKRVNTCLRHPVFGYEVSYRRAFELQFRLLARALAGEIADYQGLITR